MVAAVPNLIRRPKFETLPLNNLPVRTTSDFTIPKAAVVPASAKTLPLTMSPSRKARIAWLPKSARVAPTEAPRRADLRLAYLTPVSNRELDSSSTISPRTSLSIVRTSVSSRLGTSGCGTRIFTVWTDVEPMT